MFESVVFYVETLPVLNVFCVMDLFESQVKPADSSEKCIGMRKIEIVTFIEVNEHFWILEVINDLVACIHC
jgi:hypothetical protein